MGIAGTQIAKLFNCNIIIVSAGSKDKMDKCKELGADYAVDHREPDWYKKVREITNKMWTSFTSISARTYFYKN
jgi:alcohol dehydrogenase